MIDLIETQQDFLKTLEKSGKSFNTVKNYRADLQVFNKFLTQHQGPLKLKNFTVTQVQEYAGHLERLYPSSNSIRRRVQALRLYFDFLVQKHQFPDNPIKLVPVAPKVLEKPTPPSYAEVLKTVAHLVERAQQSAGLERLCLTRNLVMVGLIYETGIKVSDLARLELSDLLPDKKGARVLVRPPKRDPYSVPISAPLRDFVSRYRKELRELWPEDTEPRYLLFNANPHRILSGTLSPRGIEMVFEELRRQLKLEMTARTLRQAAVLRWMLQGHDASQVREWLGVAPDYDMGLFQQVFNDASNPPVYSELTYV